jgi:hypothetical protein
MKKPDFYCQSFINNHGCLKKFEPNECKNQCHNCMDVIIDHHFNKKNIKNGKSQKSLKEPINRLD